TDCDALTARTVFEGELAIHGVDLHVVARVELTMQDLLTQSVFDLALHRTTQRSGAERRVEADVDETLLGGLRQLDRHVAIEQTLAEALREQNHDLDQFLLRQLREDDDVVDTVEELGLEVALELFVDLALHPLVAGLCVALDL